MMSLLECVCVFAEGSAPADFQNALQCKTGVCFPKPTMVLSLPIEFNGTCGHNDAFGKHTPGVCVCWQMN